MIPIRVTMHGWMRYRDEAVADFSEGNLIAICGVNGAGKSSIFDAMTFALYGQHRLGKQKVEELISEDLDYCSVDFEFEVDGQRYLAHRGRGTKSGDGKQSLYVRDDGAEEPWVPVAGTEKEAALNEAVRKITRLTYEAFTSSFMLQQGGATEFIDSDPKDRFDILSSLIGLEAYKDLEKRANEAAKAEKTKLTLIDQQLAEMGDIDEATIGDLKRGAALAEHRLSDAQACAKAAAGTLAGAEQYGALRTNIAGLEAKLAADAEIVSQREQIERDAETFQKIASAIATVTQIRNALADASRSEAVAADARKQAASIDLKAMGSEAERAASALKTAGAALKAAERGFETAAEAESAAKDFAQLASQVLDGRASIVSFEERVRQIDTALKSATATGKKLDAAAEEARGALEEADATLQRAHASSAGALARRNELDRQLAERKAAAKEATCSRCGQRVDKAAAKREVQELTVGLQEAQGEVASTSAAERAASKARAAANSNVDVAAKSANAHAQKLGALAGQRTEAITGREQAATALAAHESKLNGRMKDVETAASALKAATAQLHEARLTRDAKAAERDAAAEAEQRTRDANQQARGTLAELEATAKGQAEVAAVHRKSAAASASGLGELCEKALNDPDEVMRALTASERELAGALERKAALAEAQERHIALSAQRTMLVKQAEAIPEAHRIDVATAREAAVAATADLEVAQTHRDEAVKSVAGAEERLALAMSRREERARCALRHKRLNKLKQLLGQEGAAGRARRRRARPREQPCQCIPQAADGRHATAHGRAPGHGRSARGAGDRRDVHAGAAPGESALRLAKVPMRRRHRVRHRAVRGRGWDAVDRDRRGLREPRSGEPEDHGGGAQGTGDAHGQGHRRLAPGVIRGGDGLPASHLRPDPRQRIGDRRAGCGRALGIATGDVHPATGLTELLCLFTQTQFYCRVITDAVLRGVLAHVLGDLHAAEVRAAHRAEVRGLRRPAGSVSSW